MKLSDYIKKWAEEHKETNTTFKSYEYKKFKEKLLEYLPELKNRNELDYKCIFNFYLSCL